MRKHPAAGMKAWWKSFRYKILAAAMAAAVIFAAAAVPVGASASSVKFYGGSYSTTDPFEFEMVDMSGSTRTYAGFYILEISGNFESDNIYNITFQANNAISLFQIVGTDLAGFYTENKATNYMSSTSGQIITDVTLQIYENGTAYPQFLISIDLSGINIESDTGYIYLHTNKRTDNGSNAQILTRNLATFIGQSTGNKITQTVVNEVTNIVNAIENINTQDIIDALQQIFTYGSDYEQIDQTTINNFGTAESQLSSAEGAVRNKSGSLKDSVSSQWTENTTKTRAFVSTVAPAAAAITGTITDIVAVMPEEVQTLLTVLPLLIFIGWLLGRIGGG